MEKSIGFEKRGPLVKAECESTIDMEKMEHLTRKETREIVTPYAFFVADDLLGTPLAKPFCRGFSLLIDLIFVSLLTQVSSLVLAIVAAWTFFRASNRLKTKKRFNGVRIFLRLVVALLLFSVVIGIVDEFNSSVLSSSDSAENSTKIEQQPDGIEIVALTAKYLMETNTVKQKVANGDCVSAYDCFKTLGETLVTELVTIGMTKEAIEDVKEGYLDAAFDSLNPKLRSKLSLHLQQYTATLQNQATIQRESHIETADENDAIKDDIEPNKQEVKSKGILTWFYSLVEQLGLGVSWAAIYFSVFTAWWKGQTPGKRIMGVKVIKLDNKPLNLWESFGRYGGYAAGLATGLMGFLQVFWDPNRQAIQDKISETLVINLRKPKVPFSREESPQHGK